MTAVRAVLLGAAMGVAIAAPVGPIAALCIERTFTRGARAGVATALGAGLADAAFGALAVIGVGFVTSWVIAHEPHLRVLGTVVLAGLAYSAWRNRKALVAPAPAGGVALAGAATSGFLLAASNPVTIVTFAVALATFGGDALASGSRVVVALGVLAGSAGWYAGLSGAAWLVRRRLGPAAVAQLGTVSALFLAACALFSAVLAARALG